MNFKKEDLKRVIKEHGDSFYSGNLIKDIYVEEESLSERYDVEWAEEIIDEILSEEVILLQVGEDFTECGVFTVRININDLKNGDFSKCTFEWSQS